MPTLVHPKLRAQEDYLERTFKFLDTSAPAESPAGTTGETHIVNIAENTLEYIPYAAAKLLRSTLFDRMSNPLSHALEFLLAITPPGIATSLQVSQSLNDENQSYVNNTTALLFTVIAVCLNNKNTQRKEREQDAFNITMKKYQDIASHLMFTYGYEKKSGTLKTSLKHLTGISTHLKEIEDNLSTYFSSEKVDQILAPLHEALQYIVDEATISSLDLVKSVIDGCKYFDKEPNRPNGPSYIDFLAHTTTQASEYGSKSNTLRASDLEEMHTILKDATNNELDEETKKLINTQVAQASAHIRQELVTKFRKKEEKERPTSPVLNLNKNHSQSKTPPPPPPPLPTPPTPAFFNPNRPLSPTSGTLQGKRDTSKKPARKM